MIAGAVIGHAGGLAATRAHHRQVTEAPDIRGHSVDERRRRCLQGGVTGPDFEESPYVSWLNSGLTRSASG